MILFKRALSILKQWGCNALKISREFLYAYRIEVKPCALWLLENAADVYPTYFTIRNRIAGVNKSANYLTSLETMIFLP